MKQVSLLAIDKPETCGNSKWQELSTFQQILIRYNTQSKTRRSFLRTAAAAAASLLGTSSSQMEEELKEMNTALGSNLKDIEVTPDDGGGQYQGNSGSTGFTETGKDPVSGFGEPQVIGSPGANLPPVSQNGRTATAGNGSLEVYDQDGNQIFSAGKGTETVPLLMDGGSTVFGSDATGLYKYDVDSGSLSASFDDTGSQGALKTSNGTVAVESDGRADFLDAEDLSRVSRVTNSGPTSRSLVFASGRNVLYEDGEGVESVDPQTGEKRWSVEPFGNRVSNAGAATNGDVYVATDSAGRAHIFDVADGSKRKTLDIGEEPSVSSPVFDGEGGLLLASQRLHRYELEDFSKDWEAPIDGEATTTTAFDNVAAVSSANGVALYDLDTGQEVDRVLSDKPVSLHGMLAGDAIYSVSGGDLHEIPVSRNSSEDTEVAPDDGGGQYQGNPQSTGFTETGKDPVSGFGEPQVTASPGANLPTVSLNGRTAAAGNGSLEVYDQDGNQIASFDRGTESVPVLVDGGDTLYGSDSTGLHKFDVPSQTELGSVSDDIAANRGALKLSQNDTLGVSSAGNVAFIDAETLDVVSNFSVDSAGLRNTVFASNDNALTTDDSAVRSLNPKTGEIRWSMKDQFGSRVVSNGAATNGEVYAVTDSAGRAHIYNVADGSKRETLDIGGEKSVSSPVFDTDGNLYTLTGALTKFNDSYDEVWQSSIAGLGNISVGIDDKIMVSTTEAVQMFDKGTGELVDEVLSNGQAKSLGMPRDGSLPVIEFDSGNYYEVPIERSTQREPTSEDTDFDIARTVSPNEVAPGEEVTITTELSGVSGPVSTSSSYEPQFDEAAVQSVIVNADPANPVTSEATPNGSTVTLSDVGTEATVTTIEELTAPQETDLTYEITGEATSGETTTKFNPLSIPVTEPQSVVERYDTDNDGNISITELGAAGADFASGELSITELGEIGAAFASSSSS